MPLGTISINRFGIHQVFCFALFTNLIQITSHALKTQTNYGVRVKSRFVTFWEKFERGPLHEIKCYKGGNADSVWKLRYCLYTIDFLKRTFLKLSYKVTKRDLTLINQVKWRRKSFKLTNWKTIPCQCFNGQNGNQNLLYFYQQYLLFLVFVGKEWLCITSKLTPPKTDQ